MPDVLTNTEIAGYQQLEYIIHTYLDQKNTKNSTKKNTQKVSGISDY